MIKLIHNYFKCEHCYRKHNIYIYIYKKKIKVKINYPIEEINENVVMS